MASDEPTVEELKGVVVTSLGIKVWGHVTVKVPVPGMDYAMCEYGFGHERYAKNDTQEEILKAARLIEEFNTEHLGKRLPKILRDIRRIDSSVSGETGVKSPKGKKGKRKDVTVQSVQQRARARMGK